MPLKGTSLHIVSVKPRQSDVYPCAFTIFLKPTSVSAKTPVSLVDVAACILVLNISIGLMTLAAATRAIDPAIKGA